MSKEMNIRDAELRLEQLREGHIPSEETPILSNPMYRKAYDSFLRYGGTCNTLREGSDGAGGFLVPDEFEKKLVDALKEKNVIRSLATTLPTKATLRMTQSVGGGHAVWVPEEGAIPETSSEFDQIVLNAYKLATMVRVSDELLEDGVFSVEDFIADAFANRLADAEEEAFLIGDGNAKPLGLLHQLEREVITENAGQITADDLVELQHSIPQKYRANAVFLMHDTTKAVLRRIFTAFDRSIWEEDITRGEPDRLLGTPVICCRSMPAAESGNTAILFGDFKKYLIGDRGHRSVKRIEEVYARQGQVAYLVSQRVDAVLMDKQAIAGLKVR